MHKVRTLKLCVKVNITEHNSDNTLKEQDDKHFSNKVEQIVLNYRTHISQRFDANELKSQLKNTLLDLTFELCQQNSHSRLYIKSKMKHICVQPVKTIKPAYISYLIGKWDFRMRK